MHHPEKAREIMRVSQIKFKMNVNDPLDRFKHQHAEVTVDLNDDEDPQDAFDLARRTAERGLGIDVSEDDVEDAERVLARARRAGLR
jgi:hypothetical protein